LTREGERAFVASVFFDRVEEERNTTVFQLPQLEGPYRIFVYVRDRHGNAATANYPLLVKVR
jgi:hypothetical protein